MPCIINLITSQSTIKMEKGYYRQHRPQTAATKTVAIHNKNGKGLLRNNNASTHQHEKVAIHNKNGKGLLRMNGDAVATICQKSQSTIKMEKGYYANYSIGGVMCYTCRNPQ